MSQSTNSILNTSWESLSQLSEPCKYALDNEDFESLIANWRKMYWAAAFLGLRSLTEILAGGMALVPKMRKKSYRQLKKIAKTILKRLEKIRNEVAIHIPQISSPTFNFNGSTNRILSEFTPTVSVNDLYKIFHHYHINMNRVSAYRHLSVDRDDLSLNKIAIPSFIKKRYKPDRTQVLLTLNLCAQKQEFSDLSAILEKTFRDSEMLLHGTLNFPEELNDEQKSGYHYYLLLDIAQSGEQWLESVSLNGRIITDLPQPPAGEMKEKSNVEVGNLTEMSEFNDSPEQFDQPDIVDTPDIVDIMDTENPSDTIDALETIDIPDISDTLESENDFKILNNKESFNIGKEQFLEASLQNVVSIDDKHKKNRDLETSADSISFDASGIAEVEPIKQRKTVNKDRIKIRNRDLHIRFPVGAKLILIVSGIILVSMLSLSFTGLYFFRQEIANRIDDTNISLSKLVARQAENELNNIFDSANMLFQLGAATDGEQALIDDFFSNSGSLVYVGIPEIEVGFFNRGWFNENRIYDSIAVLESIVSSRNEDIDKAKTGETIIINVSPIIPNLENPLLALAAPITLGTVQNSLLILADIGNSLAESVRIQEGFTTTVIINSTGEILAHPDFEQVFGGSNLNDSPVYKKMYGPGTISGQIKFTEQMRYFEQTESGIASFLAAFTIIPVGNLGVVTTVLENDAYRAVKRVRYLNLTLLGGILCLAILGVFLFSQRLSTPLKELALATRKIKARNYSVAIKSHSQDEVGQLTQHFLSMIPELEKVDRFQERVRSFINPQVARMIADNTLPAHAETKEITVYFSDVRNFTAISERIGDPQIVLDTLSDYFRAVVPCIEQTEGIVDKFIGDAIMAVWGTVQELKNSAENAIEASLTIRRTLIEFNSDRGSLIKPLFQIGTGINTGPASIGIIGGGSAKEEWGCIGDTINLASRVEELNKTMGTDILITQFTANKVKGIYDLVPMKKMKIKGKSNPIQIYTVLGRLDDDFRPINLEELRSMLGIEGDFQQTDDVNHNETKYEILNT